jgi:signal transduction histidine kinase
MELMGTFRAEARSAITSTSGHADFVRKLLNNPPKKTTVEDLGKRAMGMIDVISSQMHRLQLLIDLLHRLEIIRTGQLPGLIEQRTTVIAVADFIEDFVEELSEEALVDPNIDPDAYRDRLVLDVDDKLKVKAPKTMLRDILRDVLRNSFMYSESPAAVKLRVFSATQGRHVQFDVTDEGCGIRAKEADRVFQPFQRARQPQVIREYGYGLALYLCKAEVEGMGGRIWYESEEGVGTTFSFKLPIAD